MHVFAFLYVNTLSESTHSTATTNTPIRKPTTCATIFYNTFHIPVPTTTPTKVTGIVTEFPVVTNPLLAVTPSTFPSPLTTPSHTSRNLILPTIFTKITPPINKASTKYHQTSTSALYPYIKQQKTLKSIMPKNIPTSLPKKILEEDYDADEDEEESDGEEVADVELELKNVRLVPNTEPDEFDELWTDVGAAPIKLKPPPYLTFTQATKKPATTTELIPTTKVTTIGMTTTVHYDSEGEERENVYGDAELPEGDAIDKPFLVTPKKGLKTTQRRLEPFTMAQKTFGSITGTYGKCLPAMHLVFLF